MADADLASYKEVLIGRYCVYQGHAFLYKLVFIHVLFILHYYYLEI